jgi:hypothetical protein
MTDNLPTRLNEYHVPIIICPNCGEKDRVTMSEINRELNNNIEEIWLSGHGPPSLYSNGISEMCEVYGQCNACRTTFNLRITAWIPRRKFIP